MQIPEVHCPQSPISHGLASFNDVREELHFEAEGRVQTWALRLLSTPLPIYWEKQQLSIMLAHRQLCVGFDTGKVLILCFDKELHCLQSLHVRLAVSTAHFTVVLLQHCTALPCFIALCLPHHQLLLAGMLWMCWSWSPEVKVSPSLKTFKIHLESFLGKLP